MGRLPRQCTRVELEQALRALGEQPQWQEKPNTGLQHRTKGRGGVVNIWTSTGTVTVQGADAAQLEEALIRTLDEISTSRPSAAAEVEKKAKAAAAPLVTTMPVEAAATAAVSSSSQAPAIAAAGASANSDLKRDIKTLLCGSSAAPSSSGNGGNSRCWHLYVDGSCAGNKNVREKAVPAGWGVAIFEASPGSKAPADTAISFLELHGPVVTNDESPLSLGAEMGSNNTGELSAIGEALLWLRDEAPGPSTDPAIIHYDSQYAAFIATGRYRAQKNLQLAETVSRLWREVGRPVGKRKLEVMHVKGHSGNRGNELADKLANRGAEGHCSLASRRWSSRDHSVPLRHISGEASASSSASAQLAASAASVHHGGPAAGRGSAAAAQPESSGRSAAPASLRTMPRRKRSSSELLGSARAAQPEPPGQENVRPVTLAAGDSAPPQKKLRREAILNASVGVAAVMPICLD
eukprot:gnl/TRDRNA2_/TRDRNA2_52144_c0_seq1.p1 gnl/TRDRNA2_/TRDRNA2_52144_c0~~gnl/TRDRNA2_/TRDRNA2_52144_c0_seq1.p1  ORF type:complete len:465 (+),score=90.25 gnl/TRDRNA2_/TRDRNA2_52144_c0_seq1:38-1432(+)